MNKHKYFCAVCALIKLPHVKIRAWGWLIKVAESCSVGSASNTIVLLHATRQENDHSSSLRLFAGSVLYLLSWITGITLLSSSDASKPCIDQCDLQLFRHEKLERQNWVSVSSYANDIVEEFQAWRAFASSQCGLLSIFFDKQTGISTIHQLLNVSASQGPLCSSATLGNVTRQSSVCHTTLQDNWCMLQFFFFFYPFFSSLSSDLFESFTFNNPTWLSCLPLSLILANQMEKAREVGMILNISARADFDLVFWMP